MRKKTLILAISLALAGTAVAQPDQWRADPNHDPDHGPLAAPRTDSHPIDQLVFLAEYGIEAAQEALEEWESDPARRDRLHQRPAYRKYAQKKANIRLEERLKRAKRLEVAAADSSDERVATPAVDAGKNANKDAGVSGQGLAAGRDSQDGAADMDFSAELDRLRSKVATLTAERDELARRLASLEVEHEQLQVAHADLKDRHKTLAAKHEVLTDDHERLLADNARLEERYAGLERRYESVVVERDELLARLADEGDAARVVQARPAPDKSPPPADGHRELAAVQQEAGQEAVKLNARGLKELERKRPERAIRWFLQAAHAGSTNAMNSLGFLYERGWGALPSAQEALHWYHKAAEGGHVHAMRNLSRFYDEGLGVLPDPELAAYWRRRADEVSRSLAAAGAEGDREPRG